MAVILVAAVIAPVEATVAPVTVPVAVNAPVTVVVVGAYEMPVSFWVEAATAVVVDTSADVPPPEMVIKLPDTPRLFTPAEGAAQTNEPPVPAVSTWPDVPAEAVESNRALALRGVEGV